jgi:chaperonin GroES
MVKMEMIKKRILVKADELPETTKGGLYMAKQGDVSEDDRHIYSHTGTGKVVRRAKNVVGIEVGDRVFFGKHVGAPIKIEGEQYLMMKEEDIQATVGNSNIS